MRSRMVLLVALSLLPELATAQSLFVGRAAESFFAPRKLTPAPASPAVLRKPATVQSDAIYRIRHLIGQAESRRHGYDAVQHGARIKPRWAPTQMSIAQIYQWIDDTPGQPHAIGRYQFIPKTLRRLVRQLGVEHREIFSPALQDRLADILLEEAGMPQFKAGEITRHAFMNNLAKIWAGLPNATGKSHYHGYAGNKATMSWARFDREMAEIFPSSS